MTLVQGSPWVSDPLGHQLLNQTELKGIYSVEDEGRMTKDEKTRVGDILRKGRLKGDGHCAVKQSGSYYHGK